MRVSNRHFALTFKKIREKYCLVLQDLNSTHGTIVTYDSKGHEFRRGFDWIIGGLELATEAKEILIQLDGSLPFRTVPAQHEVTSPTYIANVEQFLEQPAVTDDLLQNIQLGGQDTELNTGTHTPVQRPIRIIRAHLGAGGFGDVMPCWDVSTGEETACKRPRDPKYYDAQDWRNEIAMMRKFSHPHIVRLVQADTGSPPAIWLEYLSGGNLNYQHGEDPFVYDECCVILLQSADALEYLHKARTTHRLHDGGGYLVTGMPTGVKGAAAATTAIDHGAAANTAAVTANRIIGVAAGRKTRGADLEPTGHKHKRHASDSMIQSQASSTTSKPDRNYWMNPLNSMGGGSAL
ncbi:serine/threonine-protein kinase-like protein [Apiospora phragmitis]|uniref:mitogen-activated protein kinase n=1 Tax=Apiospora phragmitis TaxID=2905665 RepID=A0ABR1WWF2_9PEZI